MRKTQRKSTPRRSLDMDIYTFISIFSLNTDLFENLDQTLGRVFHQDIQTPRSCSSRGLDILMKHSSSCLIYYMNYSWLHLLLNFAQHLVQELSPMLLQKNGTICRLLLETLVSFLFLRNNSKHIFIGN